MFLTLLALVAALLLPSPAAAKKLKKGPPRHLIIEAPSSTPMFQDSQGASEPPLPMIDHSETDIDIHGGLMRFWLHNASLDEVVNQIGEQTGLQFVHRGRLHANVSANLVDLPVDKAMKLLFESTPYNLERNGDIYVIAPSESRDNSPIMQEVRFQYVEVDPVLAELRQAYSRVNTPNVGFGPLPDKTGIYVVAPPALLDQVLEFLQEMDREVPQVLIEGLVVEFLQTDLIQFGLSITEGSAGHFSEIGFRPGNPFAPLLSFLFQKDASLMGAFRATIDSLAEEQRAHIVSRPYVVTRSGRQANISSTEILTIRSERLDSGERLLSTDDITAGTQLQITPTVNADHTVTMKLNVQQSEFVEGLGASSDEVARRLSDDASVSLNVRDGETIVLGGFIRTEQISTYVGVPFLRRIPLLKEVFAHHEKDEDESEVVFILTPKNVPFDFGEFYTKPLPKPEMNLPNGLPDKTEGKNGNHAQPDHHRG